MVNNNFTAIVIVAVVVALVASFATASIVGNTIKVQSKDSGTKIYTKTEIDKKLDNLVTEEEFNNLSSQVGKALGQCIVYKPWAAAGVPNIKDNCNRVCKVINNMNRVCALGIFSYVSSDGIGDTTRFVGCGDEVEIKYSGSSLSCVCC